MISAAVNKRWCVFRILPAGLGSWSSESPLMSGIIDTPSQNQIGPVLARKE